MQSHLTKVHEFNTSYGLLYEHTLTNMTCLLNLVKEEAHELATATTLALIADGLADSLYVVLGFWDRAGYQSDLLVIPKECINYDLRSYQTILENKVETLSSLIIEPFDDSAIRRCLIDLTQFILLLSDHVKLDIDKCFLLVHQNNMLKVCKDELTAQATVIWYLQRPHLGYLTPQYYKTELAFVVINTETGKVLKSIDWAPLKEEDFIGCFV